MGGVVGGTQHAAGHARHALAALLASIAFVALSAAPARAGAPVCPSSNVYATVGVEVTVNATCTDPDGHPLTYTLPNHTNVNGYPVTAEGSGPATLHLTVPDSYNPDNDNHIDSISFQACDPAEGCGLGTATVLINMRPVCTGNPAITTKHHTAKVIDLDTLCSDPDTYPVNQLLYDVVSNPAHGTLGAIAANGTVTYTPSPSYAGGPDSFVIQANDTRVTSAERTVNLTVGVNTAPACQPASADVAHNTPTQLTLSCSDADGDALTLALAAFPAHGALSAFVGNSATYTPESGYSGADSFTYTASDEYGGTSAPAAVSLNVAAGPPATPTPTPTPTPAPSFAPTTAGEPQFTAGFAALLGGAAKSAAKVDASQPALDLGVFRADLCPNGCTVNVVLVTGGKANAAAAKLTTLGKKAFLVPKGTDKRIKLKLNAAAKKLLRGRKKLKASLGIAITDTGTGAKQATTRALTLKVRKKS